MSSYTHSRRRLDYLDDQIDDLVDKYKKVKDPHPVLYELLKSPEESSMLLEVLERHISLLKSRSQDLDDCQITVYDEALLILTKNGRDLSYTGALELYIKEFVGIKSKGTVEEMKLVLDKHIALKTLLHRISETEKKMAQRAASAADKEDKETKGHSSSPSSDYRLQERQTKSLSSNSTGVPEVDEKIARILDVYAKAKDDYYNLDYTNLSRKLNAARFLRDTAENTINYLRAHDLGDHPMIQDLKDTFETMKEKATILSGGRKRRFEITEADKRFPPPPLKKQYQRFGHENRRPDYYRP